MPQPQEQVFLITYHQNGLLMRDRYFEEAEPAHKHFAYLNRLFPEAQVELHILAIHQRKTVNSFQAFTL
jgi:hypothetical protein